MIMTPLERSQLDLVNTIVQGQIELPSYILYKEAPNAPYLTSDALGGNETGSRAMSGRNFVERTRLM